MIASDLGIDPLATVLCLQPYQQVLFFLKISIIKATCAIFWLGWSVIMPKHFEHLINMLWSVIGDFSWRGMHANQCPGAAGSASQKMKNMLLVALKGLIRAVCLVGEGSTVARSAADPVSQGNSRLLQLSPSSYIQCTSFADVGRCWHDK